MAGLKLAVMIKQVPDAGAVSWDKKTGAIRRGGEGVMDPAARHALEAALRLMQEHGGEITAICMGPPQAEEALREALALGATRAVLVTGRPLAGADTPATSYTLARAVKAACPDFDLILLGCHSTDGETGQVGPHLCEELDVAGAAYVDSLAVRGRELTVERSGDGVVETYAMDLPALVTVTLERFEPRHAPMAGVERAFAEGELYVLGPDDLKADPNMTGFKGAAGRIRRLYAPPAPERGEVITGSPRHLVSELLARHGERIAGIIGRDLADKG